MSGDDVISDKEMAELEDKLIRFKKQLKKSNSRTAVVVALDDKNKPFLEVSYSTSAPEAEVEKDKLPDKFENLPVKTIARDFKPQGTATQRAAASQAASSTGRHDILRAGISISHPSITAGTLGCFVVDQQSNKASVLSNWHVLVGSAGRGGDKILQPGSMDGGRPGRDTIATLERWILDKDGDAALAHLTADRRWIPATFLTNVTFQRARRVRLGETLSKVGRTTEVTTGKAKKFGSYSISYDVGVRTIDGFEIVPLVDGNPSDEEISRGGDSGSIWYTSANEAVGLHFAGETDPTPASEHAIACHLPTVLDRLNARLATQADLMEMLVADLGNEGKATSETVVPPFDGPWRPAFPPFPPIGPRLPWVIARSAESLSGDEFLDIATSLRSNGVSPWELEIVGHRLGLARRDDLLPEASVRDKVPEIAPVGWAAIGFAAGVAARLAGKKETSAEIFPLIGAKATAFIVGAIVGAKATDGKL